MPRVYLLLPASASIPPAPTPSPSIPPSIPHLDSVTKTRRVIGLCLLVLAFVGMLNGLFHDETARSFKWLGEHLEGVTVFVALVAIGSVLVRS